jgi:hypothetical protein
MNLKQKNAIAAATQDVLTLHLNSFGDIAGTMADYTAESSPSSKMRPRLSVEKKMRAAELNGPTFAHAIVSTSEIVAALAEQA